MIRRNTHIEFGYVVWSLCWVGVTFIYYKKLLFCPIPGKSSQASLWLLLGMAICGMILGLAITLNRQRNVFGISFVVVCSCLPYYLISRWNTGRTIIIAACIICGAGIALYLFAVVRNYLSDLRRGKTGASVLRCLSCSMPVCCTIISGVFAALLIFSSVIPTAATDSVKVRAEIKSTGEMTEETIAGNMEKLILLREDKWTKLTVKQRLELLKTVADIEANYLGIPELTLAVEYLDEKILGQYNATDHSVSINLRHLSTKGAPDMLATVCHECRHAYQYKLVELYSKLDPREQELLLFDEAGQFKEEFENYCSGLDDYEAYSRQRCESDSDLYAWAAVGDYFERIEQYLEETAG